jgi:hypothetical protein
MTTDTPKPGKFPLLETILAHKGLQLKGTYTVRDVAELFGVCVRAIQARIQRGELASRSLPGRAKFLSLDLEQFLQNSSRRLKTAS